MSLSASPMMNLVPVSSGAKVETPPPMRLSRRSKERQARRARMAAGLPTEQPDSLDLASFVAMESSTQTAKAKTVQPQLRVEDLPEKERQEMMTQIEQYRNQQMDDTYDAWNEKTGMGHKRPDYGQNLPKRIVGATPQSSQQLNPTAPATATKSEQQLAPPVDGKQGNSGGAPLQSAQPPKSIPKKGKSERLLQFEFMQLEKLLTKALTKKEKETGDQAEKDVVTLVSLVDEMEQVKKLNCSPEKKLEQLAPIWEKFRAL